MIANHYRVVLPAAVVAALLTGCTRQSAKGADARAPLDAVTSAVIKLPITTSSPQARHHFLLGQREMDLGRFIEANAHFKEAVAQDSGFALAYLDVANTGNSLDEFKNNLALAERHAAGASDAERLLIQATRKGFDNDVEGQLKLAKELTEKYSDSPRAWLAVADIQSNMNRNADARASMQKAVGLAPRLYVAHTALGNSYLFGEPRDFAVALEHMQQAEALAPEEPWSHDLLGDVYRAQDNLEKAREEYTRGHELNPREAGLLEQRGHVNSFLGNYVAARADYDSSMTLGRANEKPGFAEFRALVNVHAGDPEGAITELNRLVAAIDTMGVPEPRGAKIDALTLVAAIATHTRNFPAAAQALKQRAALVRQQVDEVGTDAFRRGQEATIAYFDGWLAARRGDYATARRLADQVAKLVEPDANPRKLEPMHALKGYVALYQGHFSEAAGHFRQGNPFDPYIKYQLALAEAGAGNAVQAKKLFREVATYNFNDVGFALVRKDALQKASGTL